MPVTPPPMLMGAALLFWGWQTGFLLLALPLAILIEASRALTWRLELSATDFHRLTVVSRRFQPRVLLVRLRAQQFVRRRRPRVIRLGFPLIRVQRHVIAALVLIPGVRYIFGDLCVIEWFYFG